MKIEYKWISLLSHDEEAFNEMVADGWEVDSWQIHPSLGIFTITALMIRLLDEPHHNRHGRL